MKKSIIPLVILAVLALALVAGFLILPRLEKGRAASFDAARLLPATTLAFIEAPNLTQTEARWSKTALHDLWQEPEVQAFLQRPREKVPELKAWYARLDRLSRAGVVQAFAACTAQEGNNLHGVAGIHYTGEKGALDELLAEPRGALKDLLPAGKAELVPYGAGEIQTYTAGEVVLAEAGRDHWYFAANDVAALKAVLDRFDHPGTDLGLSGDAVYRATLKPLPADPEVRSFVRPEVFVDRILALLASTGQPTDPAAVAEWKRQRGLGFCTRIQGSDLEDTGFVYAPGTPAEPKLPMSGIELTSRDTLLYYTAALPPDLVAQFQQLPPVALAPVTEALKQGGTDLPALASSLGRHFSLSLEWPQGPHPEFAAAMELSGEATSVHRLLDTYCNTPGGWARQQQGSAVTYLPSENVSAELAITPKFLLAGLPSSVAGAIKRAGEPHEDLGSVPRFKAISAALPAPSGVFAYVDLAALVDHAYGLGRPVLAVALAFDATASGMVDASKLPSASALVKHLGPSALSRSVTPEGQMVTARGPITIPQLFVGAVAAGSAAIPLIQQSLPAGVLPPLFAPPVPQPPASAAAPATSPPAAPAATPEPAPGQ